MDNLIKENEKDTKAACPVRNTDNPNDLASERLLLNRGKSFGDNRLVRQISNGAWWQPGVVLAMQISGWIVAPIIAGLFIGKWLDNKYGTDPWLFLISVGVAFLITNVGIAKEAMKAYRKIEEEGKNNKKDI